MGQDSAGYARDMLQIGQTYVRDRKLMGQDRAGYARDRVGIGMENVEH